MNIDKLLTLLPEERRKVRLGRRARGAYRQQPERDPDEMLAYLMKHGIRSAGQLQKKRNTDKGAPTVQDFVRTFGSWSSATEQIYGKPRPFSAPRNDPEYMTKCCCQFNLWTQEAWLTARRKADDVIPSARQVRTTWGDFTNLFFAAKKRSAEHVFDEYARLERRLGRIPTVADCRKRGIDLTPLRKLLGRKTDIDELLRLRNAINQES